MQTIKQQLYEHCVKYVNQRIAHANAAVAESQASANTETKSTAGDKHDVARAMMQLAAEQNAKHLAVATKLRKALQIIDPEKKCKKVELGSLVIASNGNFYISVSVGKIDLDGTVYFAISPSSPMAQVLIGKKAGDQTSFNNLSITIKEIV